jgi:hypothetical protein
MFNLSIDQLNTLGQRAQSMQSMQGFQPLPTRNAPGVVSNQQLNPTITAPALATPGLQMTSLDPTAMIGDGKEAKGQRNVAGLTKMAGSFGSSLLGIGGAMMGNLQRQSENQSLDYLAYQNDMQNSMQDVNRGGGLQLLMMGGKVKPRKYPQGGVVGGEMPQPVQTEVKEKIITQDGSIFDTKATKKHKDMKSSEITDVLPADSYVISNRIMLKKSKAEKIVLGLQPLLYKEGGDKSKYKEFRLSDIFTKDEMSLSELTDNLRKLYPTDLGDNQKGNIFAQRTSDANKASRALLLGELIKLNEDGKSGKKEINPMEMAYGGVPKFDSGGLNTECPPGFSWNAELGKCVPIEGVYKPTQQEQDNYNNFYKNRTSTSADDGYDAFVHDSQPDLKYNDPAVDNLRNIADYMLKQKINPSSQSIQSPMLPGAIVTATMPNRQPVTSRTAQIDNPMTIGVNNVPSYMRSMVQGPKTNSINTPVQPNPNKPVVNEYDQYIQYTQNQMNGLDRDFRRNSRDNTNAFMSNVGGVLGGSMTAMAGLLGQNPRVEAPNLKTPDLPRQMDKSYFDYLAYQNNKNTNAVANAALSNTSDYSKAMNYITAAGGKAMEANSQLGAQAAQINLGLESQYQQAKNQVQNQQAMLDVNAKNETNKFINNLVGQSAGIGTNAINNIAALNNQRINYNAKNRSEKTSRYSTLINQMMMLRQLQKGMPISFGATTATATQ